MLQRKWFLIVLVLSAGCLGAQDMDVAFLDGDVEVKINDEWQPLYIGDSLPSNAVLRVGENSIVEMSGGTENVTISRSGVYSLDELTSGQQKSQGTMWAFLKNSTKGFVEGHEETSGAVLGARAAEVGQEQLEWMDEDEEALKDAIELLRLQDYSEALSVLEESIEWAAEDKLPEFQYYTGYAYAMSGENGRALKWMRDMSPDPLDSLFEEWALLTGQLMVGSLSYDQALGVFNSYLAVYPRGKYLQPILFLAGVSHTEMGDPSEGMRLYERVVEIDSGSEWGQLARNRLSPGN